MVREAFGGGTWLQRAILAALFAIINGVVLYNAAAHDPRVGYDAGGHLAYVRTLSTGRLPTPDDTHEFFSPPLPYAAGAIALALAPEHERRRSLPPATATTTTTTTKEATTATTSSASTTVATTRSVARPAKGTWEVFFRPAAWSNFACSVVLTLFLLRLCRLIEPAPGDPLVRVFVLVCLGMIPAYYKTFAMIRGEPMLATVSVVLAWCCVRTFAPAGRPTLWGGVGVGLLMAAAVLSRQWGFFLIPPVVLIAARRAWRDPAAAPRVAAVLGAAVIVLLLAGGWFYLHLHRTYGTLRAFNRPPFAVERRPVAFYLKLPVSALLENPVRDNQRARRLLPILYSDLWGDYWMHFLVYGKDRGGHAMQGNLLSRGGAVRLATDNNVIPMTRYLGRVNVASLLPTFFLILAGAIMGTASLKRLLRRDAGETPLDLARDGPAETGRAHGGGGGGGAGDGGDAAARARVAALAFASAALFCTLAGFLWFVVQYTDTSGDTIKASYILQAFPFLALLAAAWLRRLLDRRPRAAAVVVAVLMAAWAHNAQAMLTRYLVPSPLAVQGPAAAALAAP